LNSGFQQSKPFSTATLMAISSLLRTARYR
jgi:hypothetical protein